MPFIVLRLLVDSLSHLLTYFPPSYLFVPHWENILHNYLPLPCILICNKKKASQFWNKETRDFGTRTSKLMNQSSVLSRLWHAGEYLETMNKQEATLYLNALLRPSSFFATLVLAFAYISIYSLLMQEYLAFQLFSLFLHEKWITTGFVDIFQTIRPLSIVFKQILCFFQQRSISKQICFAFPLNLSFYPSPCVNE